MKILFAGGGTLGSVNPLLAVCEEIRHTNKEWDCFWVGTRKGPERRMVEKRNIAYEWVPQAKLPRYASLYLFLLPFNLAIAFIRSLFVILTIKPDVVMGAGSFVSVPVVWAGWVLRKKVLIHQQDIRPSLSNRLTSFCAERITVSFERSLRDFPRAKTVHTGNPVRIELNHGSKERGRDRFHIKNSDRPVLLVMGGSTGAQRINNWVWDHLDDLVRESELIHITGQGKGEPERKHDHYHQVPFLSSEMADVLALADVVVSRAGIGTISELSFLGKAAILVPMPDTHQIDNAAHAAGCHAAFFFREDQLDDQALEKILHLVSSTVERAGLGSKISGLMPRDSRQKMVGILESIAYGTE